MVSSMDTIGTLEDVVHHNFQDPECHESVFRPGHVANGSRELGHVTGPCQAVDGNASLMTGNALLQFAAVTFGSCILFTHRCGGLDACFQGSDANVCTHGQYTLPSSTVAAAVPAAPRSIALLSGSAEYGFCRAVVLCMVRV